MATEVKLYFTVWISPTVYLQIWWIKFNSFLGLIESVTVRGARSITLKYRNKIFIVLTSMKTSWH